MNKYIKPYLILFASLFVLNFLLHGVVFRGWNDMHLAGIRNEIFNPMPLFINYFIQAAGFLWILDKMKMLGKPKQAMQAGALFGGLLFINLGLLNLSLIRGYPLAMVISDTAINIVVFAASAWIVARYSK